MTRTLTRALVLASGLILMAATASATVPDLNFSVCDPIGVGDNSGTAVGGSPAGFDVSIRDINNTPVPNAVVTLDFSASGLRVYAVQNAGTTVSAVARTLTRIQTSSLVNFATRTGGFNNANSVGVYGNGALLANVKWRSTDIDGLDGKTGLGDFLYFSSRFLAGTPAPECNFDLSVSDVPGLGDFMIIASEYLSGASGSYAW